MSENSAVQNPTNQESTDDSDDKKNEKFFGETGPNILNSEHQGVRGKSGHHLGNEGSKDYISSIFSSAAAKIPGKGSICSCPMLSGYIEMNLEPNELETYLMYMAIKEAGPDEKIENCPICNKYYEIWHKECTSNFFYGKLAGCKKGSCSICHNEFKLPKSETSITAEEEKQMFGKDGMFSHLKGYKYKDLKAEWDKAVDIGQQRSCPGCGLGGLKNEKCNHIIGDNGKGEFCYCGGIVNKDLDKSIPNGHFYKHNVDWENNEKRCPLYLTRIANIDDRWENKSADEGVLFLHEIITYQNIK